jgi:hypothetical protein
MLKKMPVLYYYKCLLAHTSPKHVTALQPGHHFPFIHLLGITTKSKANNSVAFLKPITTHMIGRLVVTMGRDFVSAL